VKGKSWKFGSDTKLTWDGGNLGFVVEILWNWERTREDRKDMIADRNPDLMIQSMRLKSIPKANSFIF